MSDYVYGEIDWNSGDAGAGQGKTEFMRLEQGTSTVRIMGNPHQFYIHWLDLPDGSKRKVNSPIADPALLRQLEEEGFKRKPRWLVKVLDRSDNEFKLLEIGSQIYNGVRALFNNPKWGKVTDYDIDIIRGKPGTNPLYSVQPNPKERLGEEFRTPYTEFSGTVNVDAITKPAEPEKVRELMGWAETGSSSSEGDFGGSDEDFGFDFE